MPKKYIIHTYNLLHICGENCLAIPTPQRYHVSH
jgi:hypothetical protein